MRKQTERAVMTIFLAALIVFAAMQAEAQDKTVFVACGWDTSSIFKDKAGAEKFERRFYVSPVISMTTEQYMAVDSADGRVEGLCGSYLEKTVEKAAIERGEKLEGGSLRIYRGIDLSGEDLGKANMYTYATREQIQKKIDEDAKELLDANRFIMKFNWDASGKAEAADYASEKKRTLPTPKPKP